MLDLLEELDAALVEVHHQGPGVADDVDVEQELAPELGLGARGRGRRALPRAEPLLEERRRVEVAQQLVGDRAQRAAPRVALHGFVAAEDVAEPRHLRVEPPLHLPRPEDLAAQGRQVPQRRDDGRVRALVALRARVLEAVDVALDRVDELRLMPLRRAAHRGAVQERLERREDREGLVGRRRGLELRRELRRGHVLRAVEAAEVVVGRRAVPRVAVEGRVAGAAGAAHLI